MRYFLPSALACASLLAACAGAPSAPPHDVPSALSAPAGQALALESLAHGVQIYECARAADGKPAWVFKAPEAALASRGGTSIGRHYAGPTWEGNDGSKVVGEVTARDPGPDAKAIPWLLLRAKQNAGSGVFAGIKSIQRIATTGGVAPAGGCDEGSQGQAARVPYTATYLFYR